jgi:hypothetical protein
VARRDPSELLGVERPEWASVARAAWRALMSITIHTFTATSKRSELT